MNVLSIVTAGLLLAASAVSWWLGAMDKPLSAALAAEESRLSVPAGPLDNLVAHLGRRGLHYNGELTGVLEPVALAAAGESSAVRERMADLLSRAWPGPDGDALGHLMLTYCQYHDQVSQLYARKGLTARERFEAMLALQSSLFGNRASALFAERNRMLAAMMETAGDE